ncbi:phospholipase effector Tle1 domain-containing protein [Rhodovulum sp. MB263]|uniref:phospholipase effector Tle1 domain-containing protein n=1 Tax=Rhodovulum sp. (strain MB263) TaxID=308754 RepID=UPI0009B76198|nr:DUF2235 domain-containing protein [Rhodovulum sp. MB263]ARC89603.1 hypothetical protein B5V46_13830 [Rhodovulum sp. MB263]
MDLSVIGKLADAVASTISSGGVGNISQSCPKVILELGVFFDGTLNNRYNVIAQSREDASYQNALSNPALLYDRYKNGPVHDEPKSESGNARSFRAIYVEGPGSTRGEEDDMTGYAFGQGRKSGVETRVLWGFKQVRQQIGLMGGPPALEKVVIDVFGFSRGAAAARHFVNSIRAGRAVYDPWGIGDYEETLPRGLTVELRFVGIFDTVAAIGTATDDDNDPLNIHLRSDQVTHRIYHLTAGDEYRRNFRLNRNLPGGGDSFELPGAHSDVGGGYRDPGDLAPLESTRRRMFSSREEAEAARSAELPDDFAELRQIFVREGWISPDETEGGVVRDLSPIEESVVVVRYGLETFRRHLFSYDERIFLDRPWVQLGLSRIALHMMHEAAADHVEGALLDLPTENEDYRIPEALGPYEARIRSGSLTGQERAFVLRNFGHVSMKGGASLSGERLGHAPEEDHVRIEYPNRPGLAV